MQLLHDARAFTLEDVFDIALYDGQGEPHGNLAKLSTPDRDALAAYLRGLRAPGEESCPADLTGDGEVGVDDLVAVITAWGPCNPPGPFCLEDITNDDLVGVDDLVEVIVAWGPCS